MKKQNGKTGRWEHFHHVADIGVRGIGSTIEEAFSQAGVALLAVITDPGAVLPTDEVWLSCEEPDNDYLFFSWLNGIIYEMAVRRILFSQFSVTIDGTRLSGSCWGERIDRKRHAPSVEVKGATFTALEVTYNESARLWTAQCVVDV